MLATKKNVDKQVADLLSYIKSLNSIIDIQDKKIAYGMERVLAVEKRIQRIEGYRKELGMFLDKLCVATGVEWKFTPPQTKPASYEIVKKGGKK